MEDPEMEWEMVKYPSSCIEYEDETEKSMLSWILNAGLSLGKKLVITGVVISSVPIVLPPLVVISALGLAFSVPFGFVFASYACTDKLMSKLLMLPAASPPSSMSIDDEDYAREEEDDDDEEEGGLLVVDDIEKEEIEQGEELRDDIEMRIELVDDYDHDKEGYDENIDVNDLGIVEEIKDEGNAINTEDKVIVELLDEENTIVPQLESSQANSSNLIVENEGEKYGNGGGIDEVKIEQRVTVILKEKSSSSKRGKRKKANGKRKEAEREKRHEKERELFEGIKTMSRDNVVDVPGEANTGLVAGETKASYECDSILKGELEPSEEVVVGKEESIDVSGEAGPMDRVIESGDLDNIQTGLGKSGESDVVIDGDDLGKFESSLEKEEGAEGLETTVQGKSVLTDGVPLKANMSGAGLVSSETIEEKYSKPKTIVDDGGNSMELGPPRPTGALELECNEETLELKEENGSAAYRDEVTGAPKTSYESNLILKEEKPSDEVVVEKERSIDVSGDAGQMEHVALESGDLDNIQTSLGKSGESDVAIDDLGKFERSLEKEKEPEGMSSAGLVSSEENYSKPRAVVDDVENSIELAPPSSTENYSEPKTVVDDVENSKELAPPSSMGTLELEHNEETLELKDEDVSAAYRDEEKIWKEMEAIRGIVGYRAPTRSSYFEELKALYLFTGIEPPSSFSEQSDLSEFYNKLRFLKSVIGLK